MRDFIKLFIVGVVMFIAPQVFAASDKLLIIPDNIVTENAAVDSYIYDSCAELFADGVTAILSKTDSIASKPVSEVRAMLKKDPSAMLTAKAMTNRFQNSYNIDYAAVKKLASKVNARYVLLITSSVDAQNYILRRTLWDFLNIAGATVVDPAYKISTYAALIDTLENRKVWDDTYYKTISVLENRIITRGPSPQTEQLEKIKDYSRYLCPQIARNVQLQILPPWSREIVDYGAADLDTKITKKYRHWKHETRGFFKERKNNVKSFKAKRAEKRAEKRALKQEIKQELKQEQQTELNVKAKPILEEQKINYKTKTKQTEPEPVKYTPSINTKLESTTMEIPAKYVQQVEKNTSKVKASDSELDGIDLRLRKHKHNLYGDYNYYQPELRGYNK